MTHVPCFGQSEGWLPATVVTSDDTTTTVRFTGPFRDPGYGIVDSLEQCVPTEHIRPHATANGGPCKKSDRGRVAVSVFIVRWHDWWSDTRWSDYYIACERPMKALTQDGLQAHVPCDFETFTLFLKHSEDAVRFPEPLLAHVMTGRHRAALYYLWPTQKYHACDGKAYCEERAFFDLMQRVESVGVPSRYPAPAHLYRILCGKQMYTNMCLHRDYKVPVSVRVHASEVLRDPDHAARHALDAVDRLRHVLWNKGPSTGGVVKLGFSWMGVDVMPYRNVKELAGKLGQIFSKVEQIPTSCFVQEFVDDRVAELRIHTFCDGDDFHREIRYMSLDEGYIQVLYGARCV